MSEEPYADIENEKLILRDHLAADRTELANERTFLAYLRTAMTFLIAGVSFLKFFDELSMTVLGWTFIPLGVLTLTWGTVRCRKMHRGIKKIRKCHRK
jgi:putative membrane protein